MELWGSRWVSVFCSLLISLLVGCKSREPSYPPTDGELLTRFSRNEDSFQKLASMLASDTTLAEITEHSVSVRNAKGLPFPASPSDMPTSRIEDYRSILKKIDWNYRLARGPGEHYTASLLIFYKGDALGGAAKGFVWTDLPPGFIVQSIDDTLRSLPTSDKLFMHIKDNWYIFYVAS